MQIREYSLPAGWYPRDTGEISRFIAGIEADKQKKSRAVIVPHAGWYYSGRISALGIKHLQPDADTVVVIGGHLPSGHPPVFAMEDAVRTPFGSMPIDGEFRSVLLKQLGGSEDRYRDNTVEVLLPMVHFLFPNANLLWLRLPADAGAYESGKTISQAAAELNRKVVAIGSADLTHYGLNYGFSPKGSGKNALNWVRDVNDANLIKAVESENPDDVLRRAEQDSSTCSAGAVLGVMGFVAAEGIKNTRLLKYGTSADINGTETPDSFVGYAAIAYF